MPFREVGSASHRQVAINATLGIILGALGITLSTECRRSDVLGATLGCIEHGPESRETGFVPTSVRI